jgi:para-nitrobenzyl esterase
MAAASPSVPAPGAIAEGTNLAHSGEVVVVSLNHRLNVLGFTYIGEQAGSDFALSGGVGMLDIVQALEWVRDNMTQFGGDSNLVTIFGQSGGGRKVAILMSMPSAQGLFHRALVESGAVLRLKTREDAILYRGLLLAELGLRNDQVRELQSVPLDRLLAANAASLRKTDQTAPGYTANTPMVDGKAIPTNPWTPPPQPCPPESRCSSAGPARKKHTMTAPRRRLSRSTRLASMSERPNASASIPPP